MVSRPVRAAFTLIELLVVIAIISVLMALLVPAVQKVREAANKMRCGSNLRQIAIACHDYHADQGRLPPGFINGPNPNGLFTNNACGVSMLAFILPFMEQDKVFRLFQFVDGGSPDAPLMANAHWFNFPIANRVNNRLAGAYRFEMYTCPSDDLRDSTITQITYYGEEMTHFSNLNFPWFNGYFSPTHNLGRTNYLGVAGSSGEGTNRVLSQFVGVFGNRSKLTLGQLTVQDGTSNTLMIGECLGGSPIGPRDRTLSWVGMGCMGVYWGLIKGNEAPPPTPIDGSTGGPVLSWRRFGSRHPNAVQFAFADGSIRTLRHGATIQAPRFIPANMGSGGGPNPDWAALQQLGGRKDGLTNSVAGIAD